MKVPEKVLNLCNMLENKKASDIVVCDTTKLKNYGDYFIIATAENCVHIKEISDYICANTCGNNDCDDGAIKEGFNLSEWIVINFDKIFVEIFTKEEREHYNLEKLFNEGKNIYTLKRIHKALENEEKKNIVKENKLEKKEKNIKITKSKSSDEAKEKINKDKELKK